MTFQADHESNSRNHARAVAAFKAYNLEQTLVCPKCHEVNRPGGTNHIALSEQDGWADCEICATHYRV